VEHLKVGDQVLIPLYAFSWRERLVVPAVGLFSLHEAEPQQRAMLGINPPTASLLLDETPDLKPGDWVVQNAARPVTHRHRQSAGHQDNQSRASPGAHPRGAGLPLVASGAGFTHEITSGRKLRLFKEIDAVDEQCGAPRGCQLAQ
jgi:hypothetical protein